MLPLYLCNYRGGGDHRVPGELTSLEGTPLRNQVIVINIVMGNTGVVWPPSQEETKADRTVLSWGGATVKE